MKLWAEDHLGMLGAALQQARDAVPTVLVIEGDAGAGKSALLDELVRQADTFAVLTAIGSQDDQVPFAVLRQLGVEVPLLADGVTSTPFVAAQGLRVRVDELSRSGPVLLLVDDLHWADPESVDALTWLLRRMSGDRLLVAVGTRPLAPGVHADWQRWLRGNSSRLRLTGLTREQATTLARSRRPQITDGVVERLWEHTAGNPFYLTALLDEYEPDQLEQMRMLPAPAEYASLLAGQLARCPHDVVQVIRAAAVLGAGWLSVFDLAAVAEVAEPAAAVQELADAGLLSTRLLHGTVSVRLSHALVRAGVYQQTPMPIRRRLHARAAAVVATEGAVLEHRMAAAARYDEDLAASMESYAHRLYARRSFRLAAQHLVWSSVLTADPKLREQRWLDSLTCRTLDEDRAAVHAESDRVGQADDAARRALVLGHLAVIERRRRNGIDLLAEVAKLPLDAVDPVVRYRVEVILAWGRIGAGHPTALIAEGLERARQVRQDDAGFSGLEVVCAGLVQVRQHGFDGVAGDLAVLPELAAVAPLEATSLLAWRGSVRARQGYLDEAARDLDEVARRVEEGVIDLGAGTFHAFLGFAHWMKGDWGRARTKFRLASDIAGPGMSMVLALTPLAPIGDGQLDAADELLRRAEEMITQGPWLEACQSLFMVRVIRQHAGGDSAGRARLLPRLRGTAFDPVPMTLTDPLVVVHAALAAVWAHDRAYAEQCLDLLAQLPGPASWVPAVSQWLQGLVAEESDRSLAALTHLSAAIHDRDDDLPLYRAHMLFDHARLAQQLGERQLAADSLRRAEKRYRQLGATLYVDRLRASEQRFGSADQQIRIELTDRERDVLALLVTGKSYAQIARELFITQKTVGYHLGNVYAKTGISSRHRLAELIRAQPHIFSATSAAS